MPVDHDLSGCCQSIFLFIPLSLALSVLVWGFSANNFLQTRAQNEQAIKIFLQCTEEMKGSKSRILSWRRAIGREDVDVKRLYANGE